MRILYVVQRYGDDIVGGSEAACRLFAENLVKQGHEVEVLTSCARSYVTWEDSYEDGTIKINGVTIHRLPVLSPRFAEHFGPMNDWLSSTEQSPLLFEHQRWAHLMGPDISGLRSWLLANYLRFDVAIFMTYLYTNATRGIPVLAGRLPLVFQPTAHDEPPIKIPLFESLFRLVDSYLFFTEEEREVVENRIRERVDGQTVGIGIELDPPTGSISEFREKFDLGDNPYLVYVGRLDFMKGVGQLCDFFIEMKKNYPSALKLVLAGDALIELPDHPDIVVTGFLDEKSKQAAIAGSLALVQSSYFESFSIVLCEAWVHRRPALVQGASSVLKGQAMRSSGAIPYEGYAEFEQATMMLLENPDLVKEMGLNGRRYVENTYQWVEVLDGVESAIRTATAKFDRRAVRLFSGNESKVAESVNGIHH